MVSEGRINVLCFSMQKLKKKIEFLELLLVKSY